MSDSKSPAEKRREQKKRVDEGLEDFLSELGVEESETLEIPALSQEEFQRMREKFIKEPPPDSKDQTVIGLRTIYLNSEQEDQLIQWRRNLHQNRSHRRESHIFSDEEILASLLNTLLKSLPVPEDIHSTEDLNQFLQSIEIRRI